MTEVLRLSTLKSCFSGVTALSDARSGSAATSAVAVGVGAIVILLTIVTWLALLTTVTVACGSTTVVVTIARLQPTAPLGPTDAELRECLASMVQPRTQLHQQHFLPVADSIRAHACGPQAVVISGRPSDCLA